MPRYTTNELGERIANAANAAGINPRIAVEQLRQESVNFNPLYVYGPGKSPAGAEGLAQFIPDTWARYGRGNPFEPDNAIEAYVKYISFLLDTFNERYDIALAAYNSGEHRAEYRAAAREGRPINWAVMPAGIQRETKPYVEKILRAAGFRTDVTYASTDTNNADSNNTAEAVTSGVGILALVLLAGWFLG